MDGEEREVRARREELSRSCTLVRRGNGGFGGWGEGWKGGLYDRSGFGMEQRTLVELGGIRERRIDVQEKPPLWEKHELCIYNYGFPRVYIA